MVVAKVYCEVFEGKIQECMRAKLGGKIRVEVGNVWKHEHGKNKGWLRVWLKYDMIKDYFERDEVVGWWQKGTRVNKGCLKGCFKGKLRIIWG